MDLLVNNNVPMSSLPYMRLIIPFVGFATIVALFSHAYLSFQQATNVYENNATIVVSGEGEVLAKPDIATFSFSVQTEGADASTAQDESAQLINSITAYLEDEGLNEKDIKTQYYNLNPRYEWTESICNNRGFCPPGERILRGYAVNQTIQVKVRDTDIAGGLISGVGTHGATNISGLQFTIDDTDTPKEAARQKAIWNAKAKAKKLADDLGVRIVRIIDFNENRNESGYPISYATKESAVNTADSQVIAPSIPTGENTITSRVNITYEIR